jgi:GGDEF domain-containing protein
MSVGPESSLPIPPAAEVASAVSTGDPSKENVEVQPWPHTQAYYDARPDASAPGVLHTEGPEETVIRWIRDLSVEPDPSRAEEYTATLRRQLAIVYGRPQNGDATDRDRRKLDHRMGLLDILRVRDPDPVDRVRATEFADDFWHLVLKQALADNEALDEKRERERLHRMATHDALTGLKNIRGLEEDLTRLIRLTEAGELEGVALLFLDLDHFKLINDTIGLGHHVGNEVLIGVARILESRTRSPMRSRSNADVIARPHALGEQEQRKDVSDSNAGDSDMLAAESIVRMGGDEFVLLLPYGDVPTRAPHPSRAAEAPKDLSDRTLKIAGRFVQPITDLMNRLAEGRIPGLGVSIGCALWESGMSAQDLIRKGDREMYEVKRARKEAYLSQRIAATDPDGRQ